MTTEEIKDLIASAIAGQGNQVDAGGKLAGILNAIVEMAGQGGGDNSILVLPNAIPYDSSNTYSDTFEQVAEGLGITVEQAQNLFAGKYFAVFVNMSVPAEQGGGTISCYVPMESLFIKEGLTVCDYNLAISGGITIHIECTNGSDGVEVVLESEVDA